MNYLQYRSSSILGCQFEHRAGTTQVAVHIYGWLLATAVDGYYKSVITEG